MNERIKTLLALLGVLLFSTSAMAEQFKLAVPPPPNPFSAMGFSIRKLVDDAGLYGYDPIVIAVRTRAQPQPLCPPGMVQATPDPSRVSSVTSGSVIDSNSASIIPCRLPNSFWDDTVQWLVSIGFSVLAQFTGDAIVQFVNPSGTKTRLTLGETLSGLCAAWNSNESEINDALIRTQNNGQPSPNYLGETICNFSQIYTTFLEAVRMAYLYGDRAIYNHFSNFASELISRLLSQPIIDIKKAVITEYNNLPFAKPLYDFTQTAVQYAAQFKAEIAKIIYDSWVSTPAPYIDSAVTWLLAEGSRIQEQIDAYNNQAGGQGITVQHFPWNPLPSSPDTPAPSPGDLGLLMVASSPQMLATLQTLGQQQENLRRELAAREAERVQAQQKVRNAINEANKKKDVNADAGIKFVEKIQSTTDTRQAIEILVEMTSVLAKQQILQGQRLEEALIQMAEQQARTAKLLEQEVDASIQEQLQILEQTKQQLIAAATQQASQIEQATRALDGVSFAIGALGIPDRAGLILTPEEFDMLRQNGSIPVP